MTWVPRREDWMSQSDFGTSHTETSADVGTDVGTEMTNTSWGQFQSGLSRQEILLLSEVIAMKNRGALLLSPQVLVIS